jgi:hypothetical protein
MKAWLVRNEIDCCATVVFAETRGKARALALHTDTCEDLNFIEIVVNRLPKADKYYKKGKIELDWLNPKDRIIFVKELGFICLEYVEPFMCESCSAKQYCDKYKDWENENEST